MSTIEQPCLANALPPLRAVENSMPTASSYLRTGPIPDDGDRRWILPGYAAATLCSVGLWLAAFRALGAL